MQSTIDSRRRIGHEQALTDCRKEGTAQQLRAGSAADPQARPQAPEDQAAETKMSGELGARDRGSARASGQLAGGSWQHSRTAGSRQLAASKNQRAGGSRQLAASKNQRAACSGQQAPKEQPNHRTAELPNALGQSLESIESLESLEYSRTAEPSNCRTLLLLFLTYRTTDPPNHRTLFAALPNAFALVVEPPNRRTIEPPNAFSSVPVPSNPRTLERSWAVHRAR